MGLEPFLEFCQGKTILAMPDNSTVVPNIRNKGHKIMGPMFSNTRAITMGQRAENNSPIEIYTREEERVADQFSRKKQILPAEWSLHRDTYGTLWKPWGAPHVDLRH